MGSADSTQAIDSAEKRRGHQCDVANRRSEFGERGLTIAEATNFESSRWPPFREGGNVDDSVLAFDQRVVGCDGPILVPGNALTGQHRADRAEPIDDVAA